jgi:hypothetical protein
MNGIGRRDFVKTVIALLSGVSGISYGSPSYTTQSNKFLLECKAVSHAWTEKYEEEPLSHLSNIAGTNGLEISNESFLCKVESDFETGNVITVMGLVLSKSEAALIAHLYNTFI